MSPRLKVLIMQYDSYVFKSYLELVTSMGCEVCNPGGVVCGYLDRANSWMQQVASGDLECDVVLHKDHFPNRSATHVFVGDRYLNLLEQARRDRGLVVISIDPFLLDGREALFDGVIRICDGWKERFEQDFMRIVDFKRGAGVEGGKRVGV